MEEDRTWNREHVECAVSYGGLTQCLIAHGESRIWLQKGGPHSERPSLLQRKEGNQSIGIECLRETERVGGRGGGTGGTGHRVK